MGKKIQGISRAVYEQLHQYDWPGNVRELANLLERAVILCQSDVLQPKHLPVKPHKQAASAAPEDFRRWKKPSAVSSCGLWSKPADVWPVPTALPDPGAQSIHAMVADAETGHRTS